ncbi:unnamed protein product [Arctia plantaginis]|uniref:Uncharacterized protein n=1 Tax=Arctia plantaginis TaxID=874455 RepID=A0A8S1BBL4_ARCPL|nr:unnamed protein product [Arctia plantaginis]
MHEKMYSVVVLLVLFTEVNSIVNPLWEKQCIEYFATGVNYDLKELPSDMYTLYYWPPNQRERDSCEHISFTNLTEYEATEASSKCSNLRLPSNQTVIKGTYINNVGKQVNLLFYGNEEVKEMYRACDKIISKYIFIKVNVNYVLGINCSSGGRGMLLSRYLAGSTEVQSVADTIEIMTGREGKPDCPLSA